MSLFSAGLWFVSCTRHHPITLRLASFFGNFSPCLTCASAVWPRGHFLYHGGVHHYCADARETATGGECKPRFVLLYHLFTQWSWGVMVSTLFDLNPEFGAEVVICTGDICSLLVMGSILSLSSCLWTLPPVGHEF